MKASEIKNKFSLFTEKMLAEGMPDIAVRNFERHYQQLCQGESGIIRESEIKPLAKLPDADALAPHYQDVGRKHLANTVLIKLNGGLGTSMGLERMKSLINVKNNDCFLDIIAKHAIASKTPLLLMNSFNTRDDSHRLLAHYPQLKRPGDQLDFLQHKVPKIDLHTLEPANCKDKTQLEWCPPGHGDIYIALLSSGMLDVLVKEGYRYALISNADNLGASLNTSLLGYLITENIPFLMEVTERRSMDKKGGHLAIQQNGRLILREAAQCAEEDKKQFEDINTHRYFNTNNLWLDLQGLEHTLQQNNNELHLPLIRNQKTLDPREPASTKVYQLETAMGAAISVFDGAAAIRVPRSRFAPVKTCNELLLLRSDVYELDENHATLDCQLAESDVPIIELDKRYYKLIDDLESRFPHGPPSLLNCRQLQVIGDIKFGKNLEVKGQVKLENKGQNQVCIPDNTLLEEDQVFG